MMLAHPLPDLLKEVNAGIGQFFGENPAYYAQFGLAYHNGLDFPDFLNTPCYSCTDGYVVEATAKDTGYGLRVSVFVPNFLPGGIDALIIYAHFKSIPFADKTWTWGDTSLPIKQGQLIGYINSTGFSTGNHLHLGVYLYKNGIKLNADNGVGGAIDPLPYLQLKGMAKLYIDKRTTPPTVIGGMELDEPARLEWWTKQVGIVIPHKGDGSIDWDKIPYSGQIVNN